MSWRLSVLEQRVGTAPDLAQLDREITQIRLVQADADPEADECDPPAPGETADFVVLVPVLGKEHPYSDGDHGGTCKVIGDLPYPVCERGAQAQADERHPAFEDHED